MTFLAWFAVGLLVLAVAFLWTIHEQLQGILYILRIAHADAIDRHLEDEIEDRQGI